MNKKISVLFALVLTIGLITGVFGSAVKAQTGTEPVDAQYTDEFDDYIDWYQIAAEKLGLDEEAFWTALDEGKTINDLAGEQGVNPDVIIEEILKQEEQWLKDAVAAGEISQEEAEEWRSENETYAVEFLSEPLNLIDGEALDWFFIAAETVGLSEDALWEEMESGKTLKEIIEANGGDVDAVKQRILEAEVALIEEMVKENEITAEDAAEWKEGLAESVDFMLEEVWDFEEAAFDEWVGYEMEVDWFQIVSENLGLEEDEIWSALEDGKNISDLAQEKQIDPESIVSLILEKENEFIDELVKNESLPAEEAVTWKEESEAAIREFIFQSWDMEAIDGVDWFGIVIDELGLSEDEIWKQLDEEKTLGKIVEENNGSVDAIKQKIMEAELAELDKLKTEGELSDEEIEEWKSELSESIDMMFDETFFDDCDFSDDYVDWFAIIAENLNKDVDEIYQSLNEGTSLTEIIEAENGNLDQITAAILKVEQKWIQKKLTSGEISAEEAEIWSISEEEIRGFLTEQFLEEALDF